MSPVEWIARTLAMDVGVVEWLSAYGFTQLVELPVYERALRPRPRAERFWLALAPSALSLGLALVSRSIFDWP